MPTAPPNDPVRQTSFTDWSTNHPTEPHQGDKLDAEFDRTNAAVAQLTDFVQQVISDQGTLKPDTVGDTQIVDGTAITATASPSAETYAQLGQAWAEHMPDTIPPNLLAEMNVTGDHWSSRWWANRAAIIVQTGNGSLADDVAPPVVLGNLGAAAAMPGWVPVQQAGGFDGTQDDELVSAAAVQEKLDEALALTIALG